MSNITKTNHYVVDLEPPDVRILQYNYFRGVTSWTHNHLSSPFWYLWHNDEAGAYVICENRKIELNPDMTLLMPPNTVFSTRSSAMPFNQFYIHFTVGDSFRQMRREPVVIPAKELFGPDTGKFFNEIQLCHKSRFLLSLKLYNIVFQSLFLIPPGCFLSREEEAMDPRIGRAVERINHSLASSPGNRELCAAVKMSENNFIRVFKKEMGISPQQYLQMRRIEWSRNLLINTGLSIEEIADSTGFSDRYHFSKAFKQITRFSPAAYRKQFRRHEEDPRERQKIRTDAAGIMKH